MNEEGKSDEKPSESRDRQKVGYKNPPKHSRFKKGQSGNPRGRPKGHLNLKTDLTSELSERIKLSQDGKPIKLTKQRALVKSLVARAIKGDPRATNALIPLILKVFGLEPIEEPGEAPLSENDEKILSDFIASLKMSTGEDR